ncbi:MAG: sensor domain-containing diguanylate cyclase [Rhodocyclales bacterium]|nr:sensor domain-containing diguanylate cyclase [Rhodocyclales bacterium]
MRLNTKTLVSSAIIMTLLIVVVTALSAWSFRRFSLYMAERHTISVAEAVKIGLTEAMINGTIAKRQEFLERLKNTPGIAAIHMVRGPAVTKQFGPGFAIEQASTDEETRVIEQARPVFSLVDRDGELLFRGIVPYVATDQGQPNCRQCHQVAAGVALGAVTIDISLAEVRNQAILAVVLISLAVLAAAALSLLWLRRLIQPVTATAVAVREVAASAATGNFRSRIDHASADEVGEIAAHLNSLMGFLEKEVGTIQERVAELMGQQRTCGGNQLAATTEMVEALVDAAKFKQAIEEDRYKSDIFARLAVILREKFEFQRFSVYEVAASKNRMVPVVVDCQMDGPCHYCDPQILTDADACRAKRTGHAVDAVSMPAICNMFRPGEEGATHLCVPIVLSGTAGCIVQIVVGRDEGPLAQLMMPFLAVYLRETAPVLEAKRLMDSLRENALRDAMTGLYNRHFLEEYVETLMAGVERNKSVFSVLMLDFDYFKQVNDTYGHEAGDKVLKTLAEILVRSVRGSDMVVRYGGEEFLVILLDTDAARAEQVAEKIRGEVAGTKVTLTTVVLQKTISIGVAQYPADADTFWQVVKYADVALYEAKRAGRNRVVRFESGMWQEDEKY